MLDKVRARYNRRMSVINCSSTASLSMRRMAATIDVVNPHDGSVITAIAEAKPADVDRAVAAARAAFHGWSNTFASERGQLIMKLADKLEQHFDEFTELESLDTGHPAERHPAPGPAPDLAEPALLRRHRGQD